MKTPFLLIGLSLAIGITIGYFIQVEPDTSTLSSMSTPDTPILAENQNTTESPVDHKFDTDIAELHRLLQNEINARQSLEQKLELLSVQVTSFDSDLQSMNEPDAANEAENIDELHAVNTRDNWFNEQALIDSGMDSAQARDLKFQFEQFEMEQLYLRDLSIREDWDRAKYKDEMQTLGSKKNELKNRLSESAYEAYLYASGQPNRVAVTAVLATAPASTAGILSGDSIIRYDNQRIYNGYDLRTATTAGDISDTVALEVERNGEIIQFYLPRGPLGIRMNSVSFAPWGYFCS